MDRLVNYEYKIATLNKEIIKKFGLYGADESTYLYRFPVHKYNGKTILECELSMDTHNNEVTIDVYNISNRSPYTAFYSGEIGSYEPILEKINKRIQLELKKLGVKKIKEEESVN